MDGKTVLLVEDSQDNATIFGLYLEHHGFRMLRARNGAEGVYLAERLRPDLILMDLSMPAMNGWEAMRRIRANSLLAGIPALALTEYDETESQEQVRLAGFGGIIEKPCAPRRLLEAVQLHLGYGRASAA